MEFLPNELLSQILELLDDSSLSNMSRVNWKYYNICFDLLLGRICKYILEKYFFIHHFEHINRDTNIQISPYHITEGDFMQISQAIADKSIPWPFPNLTYNLFGKANGYIYRDAYKVKIDFLILKDIIIKLLHHGYIYRKLLCKGLPCRICENDH